jgi:TM2 domain-containing membrane protein YozV
MFGFGIPHPFFALCVLAILLIVGRTDHKKQSKTGDATIQGTSQTKYCHACGTQISSHAEFCAKCGVRQSLQSNKNQRHRVTAALFAIFLGGLGIHKFYLGYIVGGILYLLFCWTFIPSLVGFVEGIYFLIISDADFSRKYNT